jgi:Trypsin-like peptidase domain
VWSSFTTEPSHLAVSKSMIRPAIGFIIAMVASAPFHGASAQTSDDALRVYAVNILQAPEQSVTGYGIYLGNGLVISAAHVVPPVASRTTPSVRIAGLDLPAKVIKEGSFERIDLTLLSVDEHKLPDSVRMLRMPLCEKPSWVGAQVIVAVPEGTARSRIMSPLWLPQRHEYEKKFPTLTTFPSLISDVATTGNSGSGVFDVEGKCLLGIMSFKIHVRSNDPGAEPYDIAKYFVPAPTIAAFIPPNHRF